MRVIALTFLLCLTASAAPNVLALKTRCQALRDYRPICQTMTGLNNCSTQLNTTCCDCAAEWNTTFAICSFNQQLNPTPTPTPGGSISCAIAATDNLCNSDKHILTFAAAASGTNTPPLQFAWNYQCDNPNAPSAVTPSSVNNQFTLELDDPTLGTETNCAVSLTVTDAAARSANCSTALLAANCLTGCVSTNQQQLLIDLDGTAKLQFWNIRSMVRTAGKSARSARTLAKFAARAQKLYLANWNITYKLPAITQLCSNTTLCVAVSNTDIISVYRDNALKLKKLANTVYPIAHKEAKAKWRSRIKALKRRSTALYNSARAFSNAIPNTASSCA